MLDALWAAASAAAAAPSQEPRLDSGSARAENGGSGQGPGGLAAVADRGGAPGRRGSLGVNRSFGSSAGSSLDLSGVTTASGDATGGGGPGSFEFAFGSSGSLGTGGPGSTSASASASGRSSRSGSLDASNPGSSEPGSACGSGGGRGGYGYHARIRVPSYSPRASALAQGLVGAGAASGSPRGPASLDESNSGVPESLTLASTPSGAASAAAAAAVLAYEFDSATSRASSWRRGSKSGPLDAALARLLSGGSGGGANQNGEDAAEAEQQLEVLPLFSFTSPHIIRVECFRGHY